MATHDRRKTNEIQDQLNAAPGVTDNKDPLYDSEDEEEDDYFLEVSNVVTADPRTYRENTYSADHSSVHKPDLTQEAFAKRSKAILLEYFASHEGKATVDSIATMNSSVYHDDFVYRAVRMSLDRGSEEQNLVSALFTLLFDNKNLTQSQIHRAFEKLIQIWEDIKLDVPHAPFKILRFIECAIADGCLNQSFLSRLPEQLLSAVRDAVEDAPTNTPEEEKDGEVTDAEVATCSLPKVKEHLKELHDFKIKARSCISEFLVGGDMSEVRTILSELGHVEYSHEFVRLLLITALDKPHKQKEMAVGLASALYGQILTADDVQLGFSRLLATLDDLVLDCPRGVKIMAQFLARFVVEEMLPPVFMDDQLRLHTGRHAGCACLQLAKDLWHEGQSAFIRQVVRLWTTLSPNEETATKEKIHDSIIEFFDSLDTDETARCLSEIDMPSTQYAEFVRKLIFFAFERGQQQLDGSLNLMKSFRDKAIVSQLELETGFNEFNLKIPDMKLDVPDIAEKFAKFLKSAKEKEILPMNWEGRRPSETE